MIRHYLTLSITALTVVLLSGCASPVPLPQQVPQLRTAQLEALNRYQVTGGLGIWTDEESVSVRVHWLEHDGELRVRMSGPLGIGNALLVSRPGIASVTRASAMIASGPSVDRVVQAALGLGAPVPVRQLQRWIRGLPGNADSVETDDQGKLSSLRFTDEQGVQWQARFLQYAEWDGLSLPALITASGGPYSIRLRLKNWQRLAETVLPENTESDTRLAIPQR